MLNWLFNRKQDDARESKNDRPLVPRIASIIEGVWELHGTDGLLVPYSTMILRHDYGIGWSGGQEPHALGQGELAMAYLHECKTYGELKDTLELATKLSPDAKRFIITRAVDMISTQLGSLLVSRSNAPDLNL